MSTTLRAALALALIACTGSEDDPNTKDDTAGEGAHCEDTVTDVAFDEVTALGFAADAVVALADGAHAETMRWASGDSSPLAVTVTVGTTARMVDSEAVYPPGTTVDIGLYCEDRVELDATLQLVSDDGLLDETLEGALVSIDGLSALFYATLEPDGLGGSLQMDDFMTETLDYDERSLSLSASFDSEGSSGWLSGIVSGTGDCEEGENCTAWSGSFEIGTWGPMSE